MLPSQFLKRHRMTHDRQATVSELELMLAEPGKRLVQQEKKVAMLTAPSKESAYSIHGPAFRLISDND
jgi:hypothetical protein